MGKKEGDSILGGVRKLINRFAKNITQVVVFSALLIVTIILFLFMGSSILLKGVQEPVLWSTDSTQYLLSAVIQSLAAILAIVVTLTLVAIQLASQTYTPRIMGRFIKNKWFWALFGIYSFGILYNSILLSQIGLGQTVPASYATGSLSVLALSLLYLSLYIVIVTEQLNPETAIRDTRKEAEDKFIEELEKTHDPEDISFKNDPILPIVDIVIKAIRNDDIATSKYGIIELRNLFLSAITNKKIDKENEINASDYFIVHIGSIGTKAIRHLDEGTSKEVLIALKNIGTTAIEQDLDEVASSVAFQIGKLGEMTTREELEFTSRRAVGILKIIGIEASKSKKETTVLEASDSLSKIGRVAIEKGVLGKTISDVIFSLKRITIEAIHNKISEENIVTGILVWPYLMGMRLIENKRLDLLDSVVHSLETIGIIATREKYLETQADILQSLKLLEGELGEQEAKGALSLREIKPLIEKIEEAVNNIKNPERDSNSQ